MSEGVEDTKQEEGKQPLTDGDGMIRLGIVFDPKEDKVTQVQITDNKPLNIYILQEAIYAVRRIQQKPKEKEQEQNLIIPASQMPLGMKGA